jgi:hypothetical protein
LAFSYFFVKALEIGLVPAFVVLNARQERQDCAKSAKAINKCYYPTKTVLGALGAVLALLASI